MATLIHSISTWSDGTIEFALPEPEPEPEPITDKFGYLMHDYQIASMESVYSETELHYRPRIYRNQVEYTAKPRPETIQTYWKGVFTTMTPELDKLMFASFARCAIGIETLYPDEEQKDSLRNAWEFFLKGNRAWCNNHGLSNNDKIGDRYCSETIFGINKGFPPWAIDGLNSGGNIVKIIGEPVRKAGQMMWPVEALDPAKSYDIDETNIVTKPWLFPVSTICHYKKEAPAYWDGAMRDTFRINPFSHTSHPGGHWPFLFICRGGINYIPCSRIQVLEPGEPFPNPYNPPRSFPGYLYG